MAAFESWIVGLVVLGLCVTPNAEFDGASENLQKPRLWPWSDDFDYEKSVTFFLINQDHPGGAQVNFTEDSLLQNGFVRNQPVTLLIHGYTHNYTNAIVVTAIASELLKARLPTNIVAVDWSPLCKFPHYWGSRNHVAPTGVQVAKYLRFLLDRGLATLPDVHIIGHSLGAHVAASAGREFQGKVGRITGLDPAAPLFFPFSKDRLLPDAAVLVDVIHTCIGLLGVKKPVGHVDFYPNTGRIFQPGCSFIQEVFHTGNCSHDRVVSLFAESVGDPTAFPATPCNSYIDALHRGCAGKVRDAPVYMGYHRNHLKPGVYYLETGGSSPYSLNKRARPIGHDDQ